MNGCALYGGIAKRREKEKKRRMIILVAVARNYQAEGRRIIKRNHTLCNEWYDGRHDGRHDG